MKCGGGVLIIEIRKTGLRIGLTVLWYLAVFFAPPHVFPETPLARIKAQLTSRELDVRIAAVERLRNRTDEATVDLLIALADDRWEAWEVKIIAIQLLGEAKDPKALDVLLRIFNSSARNMQCPAIRSYTALALGALGKRPGVAEALTKGMYDPELLTREASIRSLGIIRDEKAFPKLVPLLYDKSVAIRLSAIKALENIGDRRAIPALEIVAADDRDKVVRHMAKTAIANLHNPKNAIR